MIGIVSISIQGNELALKIESQVDKATCYTLPKWNNPKFKQIKGKLSEFCEELFFEYEALIFIMATGIVVRCIAPLIKDKEKDPAVIVIDDAGKNVISLLSGHLGGANELCIQIAKSISANPVITTASDVNQLPSVDMMAKSKNLVIDSMEDAKKITALIINEQNVDLVDEHNIFNPTLLKSFEGECNGKIIVSNKWQHNETIPFAKLIPKNIILGIGCKKDTNQQNLIEFILDELQQYNIHFKSISTIASIDIKKNEKAILQAAKYLGCELKFYPAEELKLVDHLFEGSEFVLSQVGVSSVCSTAAYMAGNTKGSFIIHKSIKEGITLSIFEQDITT